MNHYKSLKGKEQTVREADKQRDRGGGEREREKERERERERERGGGVERRDSKTR